MKNIKDLRENFGVEVAINQKKSSVHHWCSVYWENKHSVEKKKLLRLWFFVSKRL